MTTALHAPPYAAADAAKRPAANDTVYRGVIAPLPVPARLPTAEEGAAAMFADGFVQFPSLFSPAEVAALKEWIDRSGEPDSAYEMPNWCFNKHLDGDLRADPHWLPLMDR